MSRHMDLSDDELDLVRTAMLSYADRRRSESTSRMSERFAEAAEDIAVKAHKALSARSSRHARGA